jgi:hypothetical protein
MAHRKATTHTKISVSSPSTPLMVGKWNHWHLTAHDTWKAVYAGWIAVWEKCGQPSDDSKPPHHARQSDRKISIGVSLFSHHVASWSVCSQSPIAISPGCVNCERSWSPNRAHQVTRSLELWHSWQWLLPHHCCQYPCQCYIKISFREYVCRGVVHGSKYESEWGQRAVGLGLHLGSPYIVRISLSIGYPQSDMPCRVQGAWQ